MAYAAVVSLLQILKQLLHSTDDHISKPLIESLFGKLCSLRSSLQKIFPAPKFSLITINDLETKIRDTAYKAQDTIEKSLISGQSLSSSESLTFLQKTIAEVDSITKSSKEIAVSIKEYRQRGGDLLEWKNAMHSLYSTNWSRDDIMGQDDNLKMLKAMLLDYDTPDLQVISIVGMVGIGKTALANCIYSDLDVQMHFPHRAWVTVSPEYLVGGVFLSLTSGIESRSQRTIDDASMQTYKDAMSYEDLGYILHQRLYDSRYLLVVDDVWDRDVWDNLRDTFPDNMNGSRIILTTTNVDLASYACTDEYMLRDPFLDDDESWNLLRKVVFTDELESCPSSTLEKIGRKIAKNCEGLPLAIIEIGKILRGTEKTVQKWKEVEESENPLIIGSNDNTPLSKALSWSYKRLPLELKACFLYMGLLPRNTEIRTSKLIKLWVAKGFLEQGTSRNLEEKAEKCLDELVSRSLVLVRKHSFSGRTKTCGMHFLFRSLCITEGPKEDFFHIVKKLYADGLPQGTINRQQHRLCFHNNIVLGFKQVHESLEPVAAARSLLCFGPHHQYPVKVYIPFELLRVLDSLALRFYIFPNQVLKLVRLRYLAITYDGEIPPSISRLFNLEVMIVHRHHIIISLDNIVNYLPLEIWSLHKLRHLHCMGYDLPDPSINNGLDDSFFLENLLTLSGVGAHSCTEGVLERMPNLTKVGIRMVQSIHNDVVETFGFFDNFSSLFDNFDSFKCVVVNPVFGTYDLVSSSSRPSFSINIRKITLSGCGFPWDYMRVIAALPNLQMLKLRQHAFRGSVCDVSRCEFSSLRSLLLEDLDVEYLLTSKNTFCFPVLERLIIRHCYKLQTIHDGTDELFNLKRIEVDCCSLYTEDWAREIKKRFGPGGFRVQIHSVRDGNNNNNSNNNNNNEQRAAKTTIASIWDLMSCVRPILKFLFN